jgi:hypothetical protein
VVHAEFFDHDAIIVDLALAVRPDVVRAVSIIQAAARDRAARQGAKAPAAAARIVTRCSGQDRVDLRFRVVWERPALTWDLALLWAGSRVDDDDDDAHAVV